MHQTKDAEQERWRALAKNLAGPFDLAIERTREMRHYRMRTEFVHFAFDGTRTGSETYEVTIRIEPGAGPRAACTCGRFSVQHDDEKPAAIPALAGWSYAFDAAAGASGGPVFGIPHAPFEGLEDERGHELEPDIRYAVYNNFIDFHALNDLFSRPLFGKGVDALHTIGETIVHPAAYTEAPVELGTSVAAGSVFRNGRVTLEFKGVSIVDGAACALIGYDSGESTLAMTIGDARTKGGSEYKGDLAIDLETGWLRRASLDEFVVTETTSGKTTSPAYTVRHLLIEPIERAAYERRA